jgi:hypothetical protein
LKATKLKCSSRGHDELNIEEIIRRRDAIVPDLGQWYNFNDSDDVQRLNDWLDHWWSRLGVEDKEGCVADLDGEAQKRDWSDRSVEERILLMLFRYHNELLVRDLVKYLPDEY